MASVDDVDADREQDPHRAPWPRGPPPATPPGPTSVASGFEQRRGSATGPPVEPQRALRPARSARPPRRCLRSAPARRPDRPEPSARDHPTHTGASATNGRVGQCHRGRPPPRPASPGAAAVTSASTIDGRSGAAPAEPGQRPVSSSPPMSGASRCHSRVHLELAEDPLHLVGVPLPEGQVVEAERPAATSRTSGITSALRRTWSSCSARFCAELRASGRPAWAKISSRSP